MRAKAWGQLHLLEKLHVVPRGQSVIRTLDPVRTAFSGFSFRAPTVNKEGRKPSGALCNLKIHLFI